MIPHDVIDKGCKFRIAQIEYIETSSVVNYLMNKFKGELLE